METLPRSNVFDALERANLAIACAHETRCRAIKTREWAADVRREAESLRADLTTHK